MCPGIHPFLNLNKIFFYISYLFYTKGVGTSWRRYLGRGIMIQAASHCGIRHRGCVILIVDVDMPPTSNTNMCHIIGLLIYTRPCSVLNFLPFHLSFNPPFCCQLCLGDHFACLIYHLTHSCCLLAPTCVLARPSPGIQFNMPSSHNALLSRSLQPLYLFLVSFVAHFTCTFASYFRVDLIYSTLIYFDSPLLYSRLILTINHAIYHS